MKFGDYVKTLKAPLSVNTIRISPMRGNSVIIIDPNVVFSSLDSFFGGFGKGRFRSAARPHVHRHRNSHHPHHLEQCFFAHSKMRGHPCLEIDCEQVSAEINPQFAQIADENDLVVLSRFDAEATASGGKGFIDLVYPYATLKPLRDLLRNRVASGDGNEESDKIWREDLAVAVRRFRTRWYAVMMGEIKTTLLPSAKP
jgi:flagellar motor switch protein FliM